jgi:hypothetical protein
MTLFTFFIAFMAAYRLAHMLAREEGPFSVFASLRGHIDPNQATWIGRGLNCAACISVWTSLVIVLGVLYLPAEVVTPLVFWLAVACGGLILNKVMSK